VVLKTPRGGYDGKGVFVVDGPDQVADLLERVGVLLAEERAGDVDRLPRSAAYVLGRAVAHVAFAGLVLTALILRGLDDHLSAIIVGGAALFFVSRVVHVLLLWWAATHPESLPPWRRLNALRAHAPAFGVVLHQAAGEPRRLLRIAAWAIAADSLRVAWLWVALHAAGARTSVDLTVETYGVVALLGTISILPAGLGTVDAGLVATLHHAGVAVSAAVAGVVLFRVAELWVPLVAGARPALGAARIALARHRLSPPRGRRRRAAARGPARPRPQPGAVMGRSSTAAIVPGMPRERFSGADPHAPRLGAYAA
jgi:hypothetical protein